MLKDHITIYRENHNATEAQLKTLEHRIVKYERYIEKARRTINKIYKKKLYWTEEMKLWAKEELSVYFPGYELEILGPFGLRSEISIWFKCKGWDEMERDIRYRAPYLYSFSVEPGNLIRNEEDGTFLYRRDTSVNTNSYAPNTIGAINGMNNPAIPIPDDISNEDFIHLFHPDYNTTLIDKITL